MRWFNADPLVTRAFAAAVLLAALMAIFVPPPSLAGVYGGTVEAADSETGRLSIEFSTRKLTKEFRIDDAVSVTLDGKKATFADVQPGQQVSVVTDRVGKVVRVTARTASQDPPKAERQEKITESSPISAVKPPDRAPGSAGSAGSEVFWPCYHGPNHDNISPETGLSSDWSKNPPQQLWMGQGLGEGFSTVSIARGRILTMGTAGDQEVVLALDPADGKPIWSQQTGGAVFQDGHGNGPRATPTIDDDRVYALGANGDLVCLAFDDGNVLWRKNILNDFEASNITWGICESVLIDGDKLICTPGGRNAGMVALDKKTGDVIWKGALPGDPKAGYSTAIIAEVGGVRQYINFTSTGVVGVRAADGQFLWQDKDSSNGTANISSPVFTGEGVFSASGYGSGGALVRLTPKGDRTAAELVYQTKEMKNHHGGMVALDGYLYGSNDPGVLTCLELRNGDVKWRERSVGKGTVGYADGHLYCRSEAGPLSLVEATPTKFRLKGRLEQPLRSDKMAWAHPVIAGGRMYLRDMDKLLVYDVRAR